MSLEPGRSVESVFWREHCCEYCCRQEWPVKNVPGLLSDRCWEERSSKHTVERAAVAARMIMSRWLLHNRTWPELLRCWGRRVQVQLVILHKPRDWHLCCLTLPMTDTFPVLDRRKQNLPTVHTGSQKLFHSQKNIMYEESEELYWLQQSWQRREGDVEADWNLEVNVASRYTKRPKELNCSTFKTNRLVLDSRVNRTEEKTGEDGLGILLDLGT